MENYSLSDVAAVTRGNDGYGYGCDGMGAWWMIILFAMIWGWGGNGFGGRGCNGESVTEAGLCNSMNFNNLENAVGRTLSSRLWRRHSSSRQSQHSRIRLTSCISTVSSAVL